MDNINEKLQLEKSNCLELQNEINFFDGLIFSIEMRQVLFEEFKKYSTNKKNGSFPDGNNFCQMILRGYLIQQLLDFKKFFDKNNRTYSFSFIVKHGENNLKEKHEKLFNIWSRESDLESVRSKILAHSQKDFICSSVEKKVLDNFINQAIELYKDVLNDLEKKYLISSTYLNLDENKDSGGYKKYLIDVADDVEVFFGTLTKTENS